MTNFERYRAAFALPAPERAVQGAIDRASRRQRLQEAGAKQKRKPSRRVWLAAALVAAVLILMGAGGAAKIYDLLTGMGIVQTDRRFSVDFSTENAPVVLEDGHLWFTADGQHTDITDLIDQETPYIYTAVNRLTGRPSYIIVGGTPYDFGYAEVWINRGTVGVAFRCGEMTGIMNRSLEQFRWGGWDFGRNVDAPWLIAALEQLAELEPFQS